MYLTQEARAIESLINEVKEMREHMLHLAAQVQSVTHRLNCLSDKVSDQAVVLSKLVD